MKPLGLWTSVMRTFFNFGVDITRIGRMAAVLDLHYNILHITYFHRHSPGDATIVGLDGGLHSAECL